MCVCVCECGSGYASTIFIILLDYIVFFPIFLFDFLESSFVFFSKVNFSANFLSAKLYLLACCYLLSKPLIS